MDSGREPILCFSVGGDFVVTSILDLNFFGGDEGSAEEWSSFWEGEGLRFTPILDVSFFDGGLVGCRSSSSPVSEPAGSVFVVALTFEEISVGGGSSSSSSVSGASWRFVFRPILEESFVFVGLAGSLSLSSLLDIKFSFASSWVLGMNFIPAGFGTSCWSSFV